MKKSLIALAAIAATSAFAQSSVTLYGIVEATVDVGYNRTIDTTTTVQSFDSLGNSIAGPARLGSPSISLLSPGAINPNTGALFLGAPAVGLTALGVPGYAIPTSATGVTTNRAERRNGFRIQDGNDQGTGSSRIGFRGTEDLGGGLKANFLLEMGLRIDDGAAPGTTSVNSGGSGGNVFGRAAWGGVSGAFGEVRLGRQVVNSFFVQARSSAAGASNGLYGAAAASLAPIMGGVRFSNAINYTTPDFNGFSAGVMIAAPETDADTATSNTFVSAPVPPPDVTVTNTTASRRTGFDLALNYANGPLYVGFGYNKRDAANKLASDVSSNVGPIFKVQTSSGLDLATLIAPLVGGTITGYTIGGSYNLGVATPFVNFSRENQTVGGSTVVTDYITPNTGLLVTNGNSSIRSYTIGVRAPLNAATTLIASYGNARVSASSSTVASQNTSAITYTHEQTLESKRNGFQIGAEYNLSKRTMLQANYGYNRLTQVQVGSAYDNKIIGAHDGLVYVRTTDKVSAFNVGLKHSF